MQSSFGSTPALTKDLMNTPQGLPKVNRTEDRPNRKLLSTSSSKCSRIKPKLETSAQVNRKENRRLKTPSMIAKKKTNEPKKLFSKNQCVNICNNMGNLCDQNVSQIPKSNGALRSKFVIPKISRKIETDEMQTSSDSVVVVRRVANSKNPTRPVNQTDEASSKDFENNKLGNLIMERFSEHSIPMRLWNMENGNHQGDNEHLDWIKSYSRCSEQQYIDAYETLLYLEESAQSKSLDSLKKTNVKITYSVSLQMYFIRNDVSSPLCFQNMSLLSIYIHAIHFKFHIFPQKTMSDVVTAFKKSSIKEFLLMPTNKSVETKAPICGQLMKLDEDFIYIKVSNSSHNYVRDLCKTNAFDLKFRTNSTPFKVQHNALDWLNRHSLYKKLIKNPSYRYSRGAPHKFEYTFKGKTSDNLNDEQKTVVGSIVHLPADAVPYLIFGPPGKQKIEIEIHDNNKHFFFIERNWQDTYIGSSDRGDYSLQ